MTARQRGGPPECETPAPTTRPAPTRTINCPESSPTTDIVAQHRRRRGASQRLPVLDGGYADPWRPYRGPCRGYAEAAEHLADNGLLPAPPLDIDIDQLRAMWKCDGTRELAQAIATGWAVTE